MSYKPSRRTTRLSSKSYHGIQPIKDTPPPSPKQPKKSNPYKPYPPTHCSFTEKEIKAIQSHPDQLLTIYLLRKSFEKEEQQLLQFYDNSSPDLKSAMKAILQRIHDFFQQKAAEIIDQIATVSRYNFPQKQSIPELYISRKQSEIIQENLKTRERLKDQEHLIENYKEEVVLIEQKLHCCVADEDELQLEENEEEESSIIEEDIRNKKQTLKKQYHTLIAYVDKKKNNQRAKQDEEQFRKIMLGLKKEIMMKMGGCRLEDLL